MFEPLKFDCKFALICKFLISEDMIQILLMLKVLFAQYSEVEDHIFGASSGSEPSLFINNSLFSLGFEPVQDDFQHYFIWVTDKLIAL